MDPQPPGQRDTEREESFDRWLASRRVTDRKRSVIVADLVGHPTGLATVEELEYMNPSLSDDSIRRHLRILMDVGVVRERELPVGSRLRDFPYKFYGITDEARELFDENGWFPEDAWRRQYASVKKPDRIRTIEAMPRS